MHTEVVRGILTGHRRVDGPGRVRTGRTGRTDADGCGRFNGSVQLLKLNQLISGTDADGRGRTRTDGRTVGRTGGTDGGWGMGRMDGADRYGICRKFETRGVTSISHQSLLVNELLTTWAL
eukprot:4722221-Prymnesium_polylepis.1